MWDITRTFYGQHNETLANVSALLAQRASSYIFYHEDLETPALFCRLDITPYNATLALRSSPEEWSAREVSEWNLVFWMLGFAASAFGQPTGRVLDLDYRHHAILRAAPVLYAADAVAVVASWLRSMLSLRGPRESATDILSQRFIRSDDDKQLPDVEGIKRARSHFWVRLVGFLAGALPPFIKLWVSRAGLGVLAPAIGTMFVVSWAVFELLLLAADPDRLDNPRDSERQSDAGNSIKRPLANTLSPGNPPTPPPGNSTQVPINSSGNVRTPSPEDHRSQSIGQSTLHDNGIWQRCFSWLNPHQLWTLVAVSISALLPSIQFAYLNNGFLFGWLSHLFFAISYMVQLVSYTLLLGNAVFPQPDSTLTKKPKFNVDKIPLALGSAVAVFLPMAFSENSVLISQIIPSITPTDLSVAATPMIYSSLALAFMMLVGTGSFVLDHLADHLSLDFFMVLQVCMPFVLFLMCHSSEGTYQPRWLDILG